jgi:hypothetical protein
MMKEVVLFGQLYTQHGNFWFDESGQQASLALQHELKKLQSSSPFAHKHMAKPPAPISSITTSTTDVPIIDFRPEYKTLRALGIQQPYVEQILCGTKREEYRTKPLVTFGPSLLYASKTAGEYAGTLYKHGELPTGLVVGIIDLIGCKKYGYNDYGWEIANPRRFHEPIAPYKRPFSSWFYPFVVKS